MTPPRKSGKAAAAAAGSSPSPACGSLGAVLKWTGCKLISWDLLDMKRKLNP